MTSTQADERETLKAVSGRSGRAAARRATGQQPFDVGLAESGPREQGCRLAAERRRRRPRHKTDAIQADRRPEHRQRPQRGMILAGEHPVRRRLRIVENLQRQGDTARRHAGRGQDRSHSSVVRDAIVASTARLSAA